MITEISNFVSEHPKALMTVGMAAVHLAHLGWAKLKSVWPALQAAWPFCKANGGVVGVALTFCFGSKKPTDPNLLFPGPSALPPGAPSTQKPS